MIEDGLYTVPLRMMPSRNDIIANTSRIWIRLPACQAKEPNNHPITRIMAIIYNNDLMVFVFLFR